MTATAPPRRLWLCADDYGLSPGVNRAIRDLIGRGRLNATSIMVLAPACDRAEIGALQHVAAASERCAIGLHVTLTAPFRPLTLHMRPLTDDALPSLGRLLRLSLLRRLDAEIVRAEIAAQIARFVELLGRVPDFVDGHQHVQLFPQIRDGFIAAVREAAPRAWVRQGGSTRPWPELLGDPKALLLDLLSRGFRRRAARAGLATNSAFAGAYDFSIGTDFAARAAGFLAALPDGGLMMCHPGFVDDTLIGLDPVTTAREHEYAYFAGDDFPRLLAAQNVTLI
ncbi:MAG: ChbG/HpnK family deacetylase [Xanthobacteraceae bacterium]|nr:MAG: ChbG/HpnK family deacetylase [Xanthobacteraceae bacterium]